MPFSEEIIHELSKYQKGDVIPNPDDIIFVVPEKDVCITRRSLAHILQKGAIGILLANVLEECILYFDSVFLSDKSERAYKVRCMSFKRLALPERSVAVVTEHTENMKLIYVITAMVADEKYLLRKYKKLR